MGCDIHLIVQRREGADAPWQTVEVSYDCPECDGTGTAVYQNEVRQCFDCRGTKRQSGYGERNYDVFAQLANVRNGRGFAGCLTGEGFVPIAEPRGLPEGVPRGGDDDSDEPWLGDHSFSWLLLAELLAYDLDRVTVHYGIVSRAVYDRWDRKGPPSDWCGAVWGSPVTIGSDEEARAGKPMSYVRVSWATSYRDVSTSFWKCFVPALSSLGEPDNVRIVFGFDS